MPRCFRFGWVALLFSAGSLLGAPALEVAVVEGAGGAGGAGGAVKQWPFSRPQAADPPEVQNPAWVRSAIDHFILEKLEGQGLEPAPEASKRTIVRRLFLDLIGLPPTPEEVKAFIDDVDPKAYEKLVDRLLDDPRYGERWASSWLDLARYADTAGYEGDPDTPHAWRYRDYVIDSFNRDKPYDLFVREQIAGDEFREIMGAGDLPQPGAENVVALTFLRLAPFTEPRGDETRHELLSEMTGTVGSVFLGLTVGCAKCHDHKYDQIPTRDFYRMQAFFSTVSMPRPEPGDIFQIGGPTPAEFYREGEKEWADKLRAEHSAELEGATQALASYRKTLERKLERHGHTPDKLRTLLKTSEVFTSAEIELERELSDRERFLTMRIKRLLPQAMSLRHSYGPPYETGVPETRVMVRGEYDNPGEVVEAGFLTAITEREEPAAIRLDPFKRWPTRSRRMTLAEWIANPENPLTARVMVNRLWHWHFGRGIVPTPSDFGVLSGGPSHPELLDWLALDFIRSGWSIKAMHRRMVNSSTYRQASMHENPRAAELDPENKLLWRFRRRRLEAESVRDSILFVSGRLNPEQYGLPIFPPLPGGIGEQVKYGRSKWDTEYGPQGRKRSLYIYQQRTLNMPFMNAFDSLVCDESRPQRRASVTPLQSLAMYNGDLVNREIEFFAERVRKAAGDDVEAQVATAFEIALARPPDAQEAAVLADLVRGGEGSSSSASGGESAAGTGLVALCRVLLNTNEFIYVD